MPRHPIDQISQRELVLRLRTLLDDVCDDLACGHPSCTRTRVEIGFTVIRNPRSTYSTKVTYNIGRRRSDKLGRIVQKGPLLRSVLRRRVTGERLGEAVAHARAASPSDSMQGTRRASSA